MTRSALDAVRRRADSEASGRRLAGPRTATAPGPILGVVPEPPPIRTFIVDVAFGCAFRLVTLGGVAWLLARLGLTTVLNSTVGWVLGVAFAPVLVEVWRYRRSRSPDR